MASAVADPAAPVSPPSGRRRWIRLQPYLMLLPSAAFLAVFTLWPMLKAAAGSLFYNDSAHPQPQFAGFAIYQSLWMDPEFRQVLANTGWFILGTVPLSLVLGLLFALLVNQPGVLSPVLRAAFFHPVILPMVSAASIWLFLYTPQYGLIDQALAGFGLGQVNWLGQPGTAMWAVILTMIWKQVGFYMIFYLAGLQNLPADVYEAADLDGAGAIRKFFSLTLPLLMPTTLFVTTIAIVNAFQTVDHLYIMTQGGPNNSTATLLYYVYQQAFTFNDFGKASALSAILIVLLILCALLQNWVDRRVHYQ